MGKPSFQKLQTALLQRQQESQPNHQDTGKPARRAEKAKTKPTNGEWTKITVYITPEQAEQMRVYGFQHRMKPSEIVRHALTRLLKGTGGM